MANGQIPGWLDRWLQRFIPTPEQIAAAELQDAKFQIMQSITAAEYAKMCVSQRNIETHFHRGRILRLAEFLGHDVPDIAKLGAVDVPQVYMGTGDVHIVDLDSPNPESGRWLDRTTQ